MAKLVAGDFVCVNCLGSWWYPRESISTNPNAELEETPEPGTKFPDFLKEGEVWEPKKTPPPAPAPVPKPERKYKCINSTKESEYGPL